MGNSDSGLDRLLDNLYINLKLYIMTNKGNGGEIFLKYFKWVIALGMIALLIVPQIVQGSPFGWWGYAIAGLIVVTGAILAITLTDWKLKKKAQ